MAARWCWDKLGRAGMSRPSAAKRSHGRVGRRGRRHGRTMDPGPSSGGTFRTAPLLCCALCCAGTDPARQVLQKRDGRAKQGLHDDEASSALQVSRRFWVATMHWVVPDVTRTRVHNAWSNPLPISEPARFASDIILY